MALETYDLCPGGTGKKIKFCGCKDIVHELDKVISAMAGDQRAAALRLLDGLLEKYPERACVLGLKAGCQFAADDFESAESSVGMFIARFPDNPLALSQSAILHAVNGDLDNAVTKVQRALESCEDSLMQTVHEAIGIIGRLFVQRGNILAGRAHLIAHAAYSDEDDSRSAALLMRLHSLPEVPVLLKEDLSLAERPQGVAWGARYDEAVGFAERDAWLAALERLERISQEYPNQPCLLRNIALLNSWLGREHDAVAAWHAYAHAEGLALDDAVEAEATAQLLSKPSDADMLDVVKITYTIRDMEKLMETVASDQHCELLPTDPAQLRSDDQPPPRGLYILLDRPQTALIDDLSIADVPSVTAQFAIFGRETDRDPRLELILAKGERFEQACQDLRHRLGDLIDGEGEEEVIDRESRIADISKPRYRFPAAMSMDRRVELLAERRREFMFNTWTNLPQSVFEGHSPAEVAGDSAYRIRLLAAILIHDLGTERADSPAMDFNELRARLNLPRREKIDPWTMPQVTRCPLVRVPLIDVLKLADDDLIDLYLRAGRLGADRALRHLALEIERRPSLDNKVDKVECLELLASLSEDNQRAFTYLNKARELAVASGASGARWMLLELEMRLARGEPDGIQELLRTIERKYIKEAGVGQELVQILVKYGLINPDGSPAGMPHPAQPAEVAAESADESGKIWTPDSESPAGKTGESKLWLPGME